MQILLEKDIDLGLCSHFFLTAAYIYISVFYLLNFDPWQLNQWLTRIVKYIIDHTASHGGLYKPAGCGLALAKAGESPSHRNPTKTANPNLLHPDYLSLHIVVLN